MYAKNKGAYIREDGEGTTWWWLRSPGHNGYKAADVGLVGSISVVGDSVDYAADVVRPAFWLDL